jgi:hypothetical protein
MFVAEARSLPYSGTPEMCFTRVGSGSLLPCLKIFDNVGVDKHPSLLRCGINYLRKKFITQTLDILACPEMLLIIFYS